MEEKTVPFFAHEGSMAMMERTNRRLWILLLVLVLALIGTNAGWLIYENQFAEQEYTVSVQQDTGGEGTNTFTGNTVKLIGGDDYGEADGDNNDPPTGTDPDQ